MARNKKHINDKFYTKPELAIKLISLINLKDFQTVIEPSAGKGSFSKNIKHKNLIALDIDPEDDSIMKADWFEFAFEKNGKLLVIGNPPFGNQGCLAMKFIHKCDELMADTIAFVLPKSFKKDSVKNRIPDLYHLFYEQDLNDNSFELMGEEYKVPCVFQIWNRKEVVRVRTITKTTSKLIQFVKKSDQPDYAIRRVGFYAGKVYDDLERSEQSHYFVKSSIEVKEFLRSHVWEHNNTAGPRSISKSEIIRLLENEFN